MEADMTAGPAGPVEGPPKLLKARGYKTATDPLRPEQAGETGFGFFQ